MDRSPAKQRRMAGGRGQHPRGYVAGSSTMIGPNKPNIVLILNKASRATHLAAFDSLCLLRPRHQFVKTQLGWWRHLFT
jgi:hypothetical protein